MEHRTVPTPAIWTDVLKRSRDRNKRLAIVVKLTGPMSLISPTSVKLTGPMSLISPTSARLTGPMSLISPTTARLTGSMRLISPTTVKQVNQARHRDVILY
uniref:Uncharacterized protein n=1 Tax=Cacopsylla melanoneura TaxID=428564 RepID=A0A8D9F9F3_9HEMI